MSYILNLDKQPWEYFAKCLESRFETAVRSGSASQLISALTDLDLDASRKTHIVKDLGTRIGRMDRGSGFNDFSPRMDQFELAAAMQAILKIAREKAGGQELELRLAALDALNAYLEKGKTRTDGEIDTVINGFSEDGIIAQKCADMVEFIRIRWPYQEKESLKERFDDKAVPALMKAIGIHKADQCAKGSLLDALDQIEFGIYRYEDTVHDAYHRKEDDAIFNRQAKSAKRLGAGKNLNPSMLEALDKVEYGASSDDFRYAISGYRIDTSYRLHLGDGKTLQVPLLAGMLKKDDHKDQRPVLRTSHR